MSLTLRLPDGSYLRHTDVQRILSDLYAMRCVEMTGFSNLGKSSLMRLLAQPDVWLRELGESASNFLPVYIDCNRMLEMTDQGFYELVLRCLKESSTILAEDKELIAAYETLIAPTSEFQVPLSFNRGLNAALTAYQSKLVLLFDEFDEPFQQIDSRVFLNLRAKKDRHGSTLVYMTATVHSLSEVRPGEHCSEFCELFVHQPWRLAPFTFSDVEKYVQSYANQTNADFVPADADFIFQWSGGHPGMVSALCHLLDDALRAQTIEPGDRWSLQRALVPILRRDPTLRNESDKIWQGLDAEEQVALLAVIGGATAEPSVLDRLRQRHLVVDVEGEVRTFSRLFTYYLQQKESHASAKTERLWVDKDSGEVLVNGKAVDTLTRLEYQLMLLLFENTEKIVDKYQIVSGVWGDEYIDEVDDARIEKLISRLRQKVEPDPSSPRFVTTVRGRGYRLVLA